jgi:hypothetical protein
MEIAEKLDAIDGAGDHKRVLRYIANGEIWPEEYLTTNRFETFEEVENFAIAKWKELDLKCPFVSLYKGDKYDFDYNGQQGKTKIVQYESK